MKNPEELNSDALRKFEAPSGVVLWCLGQSGFIMRSATAWIAIDPFLSETNEINPLVFRLLGLKMVRLLPCAVPPDKLHVDCILITHTHEDHMDVPALLKIHHSDGSDVFMGPSSVCKALEGAGMDSARIRRLDRGQKSSIGDAEIAAVPALHAGDSVGYVINARGVVVYHSGDTVYSEELLQVRDFSPHAAIVCINGRWGNMTASEAARLVADLSARVAIPCHYDMFFHNGADPGEFEREVHACAPMTRVIRPVFRDPILLTGQQ